MNTAQSTELELEAFAAHFYAQDPTSSIDVTLETIANGSIVQSGVYDVFEFLLNLAIMGLTNHGCGYEELPARFKRLGLAMHIDRIPADQGQQNASHANRYCTLVLDWYDGASDSVQPRLFWSNQHRTVDRLQEIVASTYAGGDILLVRFAYL